MIASLAREEEKEKEKEKEKKKEKKKEKEKERVRERGTKREVETTCKSCKSCKSFFIVYFYYCEWDFLKIILPQVLTEKELKKKKEEAVSRWGDA